MITMHFTKSGIPWEEQHMPRTTEMEGTTVQISVDRQYIIQG